MAIMGYAQSTTRFANLLIATYRATIWHWDSQTLSTHFELA